MRKIMINYLDYALPVVKSWESFEPRAYYATENEKERGIVTIGYGQTVGVEIGDTISEQEASEYLENQLHLTANKLQREVGSFWSLLSDAEKAAVVSLAYNVDKDVVGQLKRSKALQGLREFDFDKFLYEAFHPTVGFVKQNGIILKGLQRRRKAEQNLFICGKFLEPSELSSPFLNA